MKKAILAVLALASVVACNKSEVLEVAPQKAISFGNPFVENATKAIDPSETVATLDKFLVYATVKNTDGATANIFNAVEVSSEIGTNPGTSVNGNTWGYESEYTQYWVPDNTYNFAAVANATNVNVDAANNNMPTTIEYTTTSDYTKNGDADLLYATKEETAGAESGNVEFAFNHLLSKVKFTFINGYPADSEFEVKVSDIKITNAYKTGTYTIGAETPWAAKDEVEVNFGHIVENNEAQTAISMAATGKLKDDAWTTAARYSSKYERLLIPGQNSFDITFTAEVSYRDVVVAKYNSATVTLPDNATIKPSYCYNFVGTIGQGLKPITFSVTSTGKWEQGADQNVTVQ